MSKTFQSSLPSTNPLHLYRHTLRYLRSPTLPFRYLSPKLCYNARELFEIHPWRFVEKDILDKIFRGEYQSTTQASPKPDSILSQHPNIENAETTPIPIPSIPSLKLSQPTSSISNKYQIPTSFTVHRPNPVSNPNNSSNADALLPVENNFVAKSQPTTAATTTNVMASSSIHSDIPPNVVIPMPSTFVCKRDGR
ncbi:5669_t:CDS:2, partial [Racocetra persica]